MWNVKSKAAFEGIKELKYFCAFYSSKFSKVHRCGTIKPGGLDCQKHGIDKNHNRFDSCQFEKYQFYWSIPVWDSTVFGQYLSIISFGSRLCWDFLSLGGDFWSLFCIGGIDCSSNQFLSQQVITKVWNCQF